MSTKGPKIQYAEDGAGDCFRRIPMGGEYRYEHGPDGQRWYPVDTNIKYAHLNRERGLVHVSDLPWRDTETP
jgi:hypothetical protein